MGEDCAGVAWSNRLESALFTCTAAHQLGQVTGSDHEEI